MSINHGVKQKWTHKRRSRDILRSAQPLESLRILCHIPATPARQLLLRSLAWKQQQSLWGDWKTTLWESCIRVSVSEWGFISLFDCVDHNKLWKILKEMGIADRLTCLLRNPCAGQEPTVRTGLGTTDWFQIGYRRPAYLTSMQSTSWKTLGWKKHKLESRLTGEISITSDMQMIPPLWQKVKQN